MSIAGLLGDSRPVLSDGAIGTMLQAAGLMPGASPEIWNVEHEDRLRVIHTAYADAGAHLLTTNTFGGTRPRLALHGLEDRVHELNEAGARLAREVADASGALAMGSIGPTGELMEPLGLYTHDQVVDLFAEQAAGLAAGGAQLLLAETFSDLGEVRAAVEGARRAAPDVPVAVTMTFDVKGHTMMGVSPSQALHEIAAMGVELIGGNCGSGPEEIEQVMTVMSAERPGGVLLMAQSNAGLPQLVGDEFRYGGTPEVMARYAVRMQELGVDVIGSCCGSTPRTPRPCASRWAPASEPEPPCRSSSLATPGRAGAGMAGHQSARLGRPRSERLGMPVGERVVLVHRADLAIAVTSMVAFPNGVVFQLLIRGADAADRRRFVRPAPLGALAATRPRGRGLPTRRCHRGRHGRQLLGLVRRRRC